MANSAIVGPIKVIYSCLEKLTHGDRAINKSCLLASWKVQIFSSNLCNVTAASCPRRAPAQYCVLPASPWLQWGNAWNFVYSDFSEGFPSYASWFLNIETRHQCNLSLSTNSSLNGCRKMAWLGKARPLWKKRKQRIFRMCLHMQTADTLNVVTAGGLTEYN